MKKSILIPLILLLWVEIAAASSVKYEGGAEKFVFLPGSSYSDSDLFENFKDVLPGDVLTQNITVKNDTENKVRIYLRAESEGMQDHDFLSQLQLTVECRNKEIFEAAPSETAQLTDNVLLGTFKSKGSTELVVTLNVPATMGNEYMSRIGVVPWTFLVEEVPDDNTPDTGDWFRTGLWVGIAALLAAAIMLLLLLQRKIRRNE